MTAYLLIQVVDGYETVRAVFDHKPSRTEQQEYLVSEGKLVVEDWPMIQQCRCIGRVVQGICPVHPNRGKETNESESEA